MTQINLITKMFYEEGKNISQISRETGYDRKTIRSYIDKTDWNIKLPAVYQKPSCPKLEPFMQDIDAWLTEDKKVKRKQRHTACRIFNRLVEKYGQEFNCSYRTVASYVSIKREEVFGNKETGALPLEHIPGEAQLDFGEAEFYEKGKHHSGKYLNLSFPYSNQGYAQLFKGENQECLFQGLKTIFYYLGGVPPKIWFDNASTMVTGIMKHGNRNLTDDFSRFMEHHRFQAAFCNPYSGHEKGNVEAKVGYHRRNLLVPVPRFDDLKKFNQELLERCKKDAKREHYRKEGSIEDLHGSDLDALLGLPAGPFDCCKYITVKTNKYGRFYLNKGNHEYSVSPKHVSGRVLVKLTAFEVIPLDECHREIITHERLYGNFKQQSMKWLPYLLQLSRRPGALKYTGIYQMLPDPIQEYLTECNRGDTGKVLKTIAAITAESGFERAVETVSAALSHSARDLDSLLNLHKRLHHEIADLEPARLSGSIPQLEKYTPDLNMYDQCLLKEDANKC